MAVYSMMITRKMANDIVYNRRDFDMRLKSKCISVGDIIRYKVMENQKEVPHEINSKRFGVLYVDNDDPRVHKDYSVFRFVEIEPEFE